MRRLVRPAAYSAVAFASFVTFVAAGRLSAEPLPLGDVGGWLERVDPVDSLIELARWLGIGLAGYVFAVAFAALVGELAGLVQFARTARLLRAVVALIALPALRRRLLELGAAASITASSLQALPAGAVIGSSPSAALVVDSLESQQVPVMLRGEYQGFGLPARSADSTPSDTSTHLVKPGDTLWEILTDRYGYCDDDLLRVVLAANPQIVHPDRILVGWRVTLPDLDVSHPGNERVIPRGEATWTAVTVKPGDTLWGIVERERGHANADLVWAVVDANPDIEDPDLIFPEQVITLPPSPVPEDPPVGTPPDQRAKPESEDRPAPAEPKPPELEPTSRAPASSVPVATTVSTREQPPSEQTPQPASNRERVESEDDVDDSPRPPIAQLVGWTGGAALAAALLGLGVHRRRQAPRRERLRRPGRRAVELGVALQVTDNLSTVEPAANALRHLASRTRPRAGETTPMPRLLRLSGDEIELVWDAPNSDVLVPWRTGDGGWTWSLDSSTTCNAAGTPHPCPCLVTVGRHEGADVLLNLESCGSLVITGEHDGAAALLRSMTVELAASRFADSPTVLVVGDSTDVPGTPEHSRVVTLTEAIGWVRDRAESATSLLAHRRLTSLFALRARARPTDAHEPVIVVVDTSLVSNYDEEQQLSTILGLSNGDLGTIVVLLGDHPGPTYRIQVAGQRVQLDPLALELDAVGLEPTVSCMIDEMIPAATVEPAVMAPGAKAEDSLSDELPNLTSVPPDHVGAEPTDDDWDVELKVLGQVRAVGTPQPLTPTELHLAIYLAFHRYGDNADTISTMLWPEGASPKTLTNTMGSLRRKLGTGADGEMLFPLGRDHQHTYTLSERLVTDWDRFRSLVRRAEHLPAEQAVEALDEALDLIDGPPFRASSGYSWASSDGTTATIIEGVTAAAERCVQLHLDVGDAQAAAQAGFKGLAIVDTPHDARHLVDRTVDALCLAGNNATADSLRARLLTDD